MIVRSSWLAGCRLNLVSCRHRDWRCLANLWQIWQLDFGGRHVFHQKKMVKTLALQSEGKSGFYMILKDLRNKQKGTCLTKTIRNRLFNHVQSVKGRLNAFKSLKQKTWWYNRHNRWVSREKHGDQRKQPPGISHPVLTKPAALRPATATSSACAGNDSAIPKSLM